MSSAPWDRTRPGHSNYIDTPIFSAYIRIRWLRSEDPTLTCTLQHQTDSHSFALVFFFPSFDRSKVKDTHGALFATFDRWGPDIAYQITDLKWSGVAVTLHSHYYKYILSSPLICTCLLYLPTYLPESSHMWIALVSHSKSSERIEGLISTDTPPSRGATSFDAHEYVILSSLDQDMPISRFKIKHNNYMSGTTRDFPSNHATIIHHIHLMQGAEQLLHPNIVSSARSDTLWSPLSQTRGVRKYTSLHLQRPQIQPPIDYHIHWLRREYDHLECLQMRIRTPRANLTQRLQHDHVEQLHFPHCQSIHTSWRVSSQLSRHSILKYTSWHRIFILVFWKD